MLKWCRITQFRCFQLPAKNNFLFQKYVSVHKLLTHNTLIHNTTKMHYLKDYFFTVLNRDNSLYWRIFYIISVSSMLWYTWYEINTKIPSFNKTKTKPNQTNQKKQRKIILAVNNYTLIQLAGLYTEMCEKILPCTSHAQYNCLKEILKILRFVFYLFITLKKHPIKFLTPLERLLLWKVTFN